MRRSLVKDYVVYVTRLAVPARASDIDRDFDQDFDQKENDA